MNIFSLKVHHQLIVDWLGGAPFPPLQPKIHLLISDAALRLLIDIIYHRTIHSWDASLELIQYGVVAQWWPLVDELLIRGWKHVDVAATPKCWLLARERSLPCEIELRKRVADSAPQIISSKAPGYNDLVLMPYPALIDLLKGDHVFWKNAEATLKFICAWSSVNPSIAKENCSELFKTIRYSSVNEVGLFLKAF